MQFPKLPFLASSRLSRDALLSCTLLLGATACGDDAADLLDSVVDPGGGDGDSNSGENPEPPSSEYPDPTGPGGEWPQEPVDQEPQPNLELCHLKGSEVVVLGDSYIALDPSYLPGDTHPFVRNLEELARAAGALGADDSYRRYAQSGASLAYGPFIPEQFEKAVQDDANIKVVIMDGGGNDVLVNNRACLEFKTEAEIAANEGCVAAVDKAIEAGQKLFDRAVEAGVQAVIYFFYPHLPGLGRGGIGAGTYPNTVLDYAVPRVKDFCVSQTKIPCHFIDMRGPFDSDGDGWSDDGLINIDGIHPTAEGSKIMASEAWDVMQAQCIGSLPEAAQ